MAMVQGLNRTQNDITGRNPNNTSQPSKFKAGISRSPSMLLDSAKKLPPLSLNNDQTKVPTKENLFLDHITEKNVVHELLHDTNTIAVRERVEKYFDDIYKMVLHVDPKKLKYGQLLRTLTTKQGNYTHPDTIRTTLANEQEGQKK